MSAAKICLDKVGGKLDDGQKAFRACLTNLELDAPNGKIKLDKNRQAIGDNFVTEVVEEGGNLKNKLVKIVPNVNQQLNIDPAKFKKIGLPSRDVPECKKL